MFACVVREYSQANQRSFGCNIADSTRDSSQQGVPVVVRSGEVMMGKSLKL